MNGGDNGELCRTGTLQMQKSNSPLPQCNAMNGGDNGELCRTGALSFVQGEPAHKPTPLPQCNPMNGGDNGELCRTGTMKMHQDPPICNGTNGQPGVDCRSALAQNPNPTGPPIPVCNGTNSHNCVEADQAISGKIGPIQQQFVQDDSTGKPVIICDGTNADKGCIEPNQMRNVNTRPNVTGLVQLQNGWYMPTCT